MEYTADISYENANQLSVRVSLEDALPGCNRAFDLNPWLDEYHIRLGESYLKRVLYSNSVSDYDLARSQFNKAIELNPNQVDSWLYLAQTDFFAFKNNTGGDLRKARYALKNLLRVQPLSTRARYLLVYVDNIEGNNLSAYNNLKYVLSVQP